MIIGITGSIGSGKTMAARIFGRYGYKIIDCDKIGHSLLKTKKIKEKMKKEFSTTNRKELAKIVFKTRTKLHKLNKIMWPEIKKEIKRQLTKKSVIDAAVLVEAGWDKLCDKIVVIMANKGNQLKRSKYGPKMTQRIIRLQLSEKKRLKYADYILENDGSKNELKNKIKAIL